MPNISNIELYVPPPADHEIGAAYARLMLGLAQRVPNLIADYWGPEAWLDEVTQTPPTWDALRNHAVAVATAAQQSELSQNRRERILRNVRAALWLIRAGEGERIMFTEQVRMLLDLKPEGADSEVFAAAHTTLEEMLPKYMSADDPTDESLADRWQTWREHLLIPATEAVPLLQEAMTTLHEIVADGSECVRVILGEPSDGPEFAYHRGTLIVNPGAMLRLDRVYHSATQWGHGGLHSVYAALRRRYDDQNDAECTLLLNLGPDQVLIQGLPQAVLAGFDIYESALPALMQQAGHEKIDLEALRTFHLIEDALQWVQANVVLMLHSEELRPRAVRRHLINTALMSREAADTLLATLRDPIVAAHEFAPRLGGQLLTHWLAKSECSIAALLADPPVPSTMLFDMRFQD